MTEPGTMTEHDQGPDGSRRAPNPTSDPIAAYLNALEPAAARAALGQCCGARRWVEGMMDLCPFPSDESLLASADRIWFELDPEDWLEAFAHHPRIGERSAAGQSPEAQRSSRHEQAGMDQSSRFVQAAMIEKNLAYEDLFGHVFLICATGKSGDEMLTALEHRLLNEPDVELRIAAAEHAQITQLRLHALAIDTQTRDTRADRTSPSDTQETS